MFAVTLTNCNTTIKLSYMASPNRILGSGPPCGTPEVRKYQLFVLLLGKSTKNKGCKI